MKHTTNLLESRNETRQLAAELTEKVQNIKNFTIFLTFGMAVSREFWTMENKVMALGASFWCDAVREECEELAKALQELKETFDVIHSSNKVPA